MNRGAAALARIEVSQDEKARVGVCSRAHVQRLQAGTERPSAAKRKAFHDAFAIDPAWWDQPVVEAAPAPPPPAGPATALTVDELEAEVLVEASRMLVELRTRTDLPAAARAALIRSVGQVVDAYKRRSLKLTKSREWIQLREKLVAIVVKFPEVREAMLRALESTDESEGA